MAQVEESPESRMSPMFPMATIFFHRVLFLDHTGNVRNEVKNTRAMLPTSTTTSGTSISLLHALRARHFGNDSNEAKVRGSDSCIMMCLDFVNIFRECKKLKEKKKKKEAL